MLLLPTGSGAQGPAAISLSVPWQHYRKTEVWSAGIQYPLRIHGWRSEDLHLPAADVSGGIHRHPIQGEEERDGLSMWHHHACPDISEQSCAAM